MLLWEVRELGYLLLFPSDFPAGLRVMADKLWSGRGLQIQQSVKCKAFSLYHFVSPGCFPWRKTPGAVPKNKHHSRPLSLCPSGSEVVPVCPLLYPTTINTCGF
jgi:hypothetical protein